MSMRYECPLPHTHSSDVVQQGGRVRQLWRGALACRFRSRNESGTTKESQRAMGSKVVAAPRRLAALARATTGTG